MSDTLTEMVELPVKPPGNRPSKGEQHGCEIADAGPALEGHLEISQGQRPWLRSSIPSGQTPRPIVPGISGGSRFVT